jgi:hypothetical protein
MDGHVYRIEGERRGANAKLESVVQNDIGQQFRSHCKLSVVFFIPGIEPFNCAITSSRSIPILTGVNGSTTIRVSSSTADQASVARDL